MNKYDINGFYTYEWASSNIEGFNELDPCCQQLVMLFPEKSVDCAAVGLDSPSKPIPMFNIDPALSTYAAPSSNFHPGALLIPAGLLVPTGNKKAKDTITVDAPGSGMLVLVALAVALISRKL
jgi:hypothetical protein